MAPSEFSNFQQVPKNRAQACFRLVLWFVPTGFAWSSFIAVVLLHSKIRVPDWGLWILLLVNLVVVLAAGWFERLLAGDVWGGVGRMTIWMLIFAGWQLMLIPVLSMAMAVILDIS